MNTINANHARHHATLANKITQILVYHATCSQTSHSWMATLAGTNVLSATSRTIRHWGVRSVMHRARPALKLPLSVWLAGDSSLKTNLEVHVSRNAHPVTPLHRALQINVKNVMIIARSAMEVLIFALHATRSRLFLGLIIDVWMLVHKA